MSSDELHSHGGFDGSSASLGGFLVVAVIFLIVLTMGYFNYARLIWPDAPMMLQVAGGFFVAFGAIVLARATAAARQRDQQDPAGQHRTWILFFVILLCISALGTMNALFYFFEGETVVGQRVETARKQLAELGIKGKQALQVPELEKTRAEVESLLAELEQRVVRGAGGNSCGVGRTANETIVKIARLLPGFAAIPYTEGLHDCRREDELKKFMAEYRQQAMRLLRVTPAYLTTRAEARERAIKMLDDAIGDAMRNLETVEADTTSSGVARNYRPIQDALHRAADTYSQQLSAVKSLTGSTLLIGEAPGRPAPESLDIEDVMQLGNVAFILKSIVNRMNRGQTYFYLVAAVVLDAFMVWAFAVVMRDSTARPTARRRRDTMDSEVQVHYLWTHGQR